MAIDTLGANALASNSVTSAKIAADAVTTAKIANDAVTGAKIPADAVVAADIADGSITTAKLAADAVTTAKIATNAVRDEMPTGAVLQTVYAKRGHNSGSGHLSFNTGAAGTFADATDMNLQITPSSTSSKVLLCLAFRMASDASSDNILRIERSVGGSSTYLYPTETNGGLGNIYYATGNSTAEYSHITFNDCSFDYLDTPSTTSQITYKAQFANGAGTLKIGSRGDGSNDRDNSIYAMEIAG